ncbi:hypothetical protein N0V88_000674 [Collariella sp. IMI 366227]|nr:hypothetical protein N0V88_000674 [Collariella sp. IMI 366227]
MEDLQLEFEGEPTKPSPSYETNPPRRPDKLPIDEYSEPPPRHQPIRSYSQALSDDEDTSPRPAHSQDDNDVRSHRSRRRDDERRVRQEMEQLELQLAEANSRAEQAERVAEELTRQLRHHRREVATEDEDGTNIIKSLKKENLALKAELSDARSHIFSLQPYRKDLTPKEVGQDFDNFVNDVTDWVTTFIDPILDDDEKISSVLAAAKKRPADLQKLQKYMHQQGDLVHGCAFPETDIDILIAVAMRFLHDNIFQKILCGALPDTVELLTSIESSMQTNVSPRRDLFALRTWRAEALNAVICSPDYQRARALRIRELTTELASLFKLFRRDTDWSELCYACQDHIVKPAATLHEKLLVSTHHFYLDLNSYVVWNTRRELETSPDFLDDLPKLRCENILQNRKSFSVAKLEPRPSKEQLCRELMNVATVVPALCMRQVGSGGVIKEAAVVRPQQVLIAWGTKEEREKFVWGGERTLMHRLCYGSQRERERERGQEALPPSSAKPFYGPVNPDILGGFEWEEKDKGKAIEVAVQEAGDMAGLAASRHNPAGRGQGAPRQDGNGVHGTVDGREIKEEGARQNSSLLANGGRATIDGREMNYDPFGWSAQSVTPASAGDGVAAPWSGLIAKQPGAPARDASTSGTTPARLHNPQAAATVEAPWSGLIAKKPGAPTRDASTSGTTPAPAATVAAPWSGLIPKTATSTSGTKPTPSHNPYAAAIEDRQNIMTAAYLRSPDGTTPPDMLNSLAPDELSHPHLHPPRSPA